MVLELLAELVDKELFDNLYPSDGVKYLFRTYYVIKEVNVVFFEKGLGLAAALGISYSLDIERS